MRRLLNFLDVGHGPTIVLIHGFAADSALWGLRLQGHPPISEWSRQTCAGSGVRPSSRAGGAANARQQERLAEVERLRWQAHWSAQEERQAAHERAEKERTAERHADMRCLKKPPLGIAHVSCANTFSTCANMRLTATRRNSGSGGQKKSLKTAIRRPSEALKGSFQARGGALGDSEAA
jgi:hypothetical protein